MSEFPEFDLYHTLHLHRDATMEDVRSNYIKIMRHNHVDHPGFISRIKRQFPQDPAEPDPDYSERISDIAKRSVQRFNVAYEVLSNPLQRSAYDRHIGLSKPAQTQPQPQQADIHRQNKPPRAASHPTQAGRHFFNRKTQTGQTSRRRLSESDTSRDRFSFWKQ